MAKGAPETRDSAEMRLEASDLVLRDPTVVMSVRLDNVSARRLHAVARNRGLKVSELLREAATYYLNSGDVPGPKYVVTGKGVTRVAVGGVSARFDAPGMQIEPAPAGVRIWGETQPSRVIAAVPPARPTQV